MASIHDAEERRKRVERGRDVFSLLLSHPSAQGKEGFFMLSFSLSLDHKNFRIFLGPLIHTSPTFTHTQAQVLNQQELKGHVRMEVVY